jgi:hypothetical protein
MSPLPNFDTEFLTFLRPPSREIAHMQVCDESGIGGGGE